MKVKSLAGLTVVGTGLGLAVFAIMKGMPDLLMLAGTDTLLGTHILETERVNRRLQEQIQEQNKGLTNV